MEKRLIKFNENQHEIKLKYANIDLAAYNKLLSSIQPFTKSLGLNLNKDEIGLLLKNPREYAFDKIVGDNELKIAGIAVSKTKAMELIQMPEAWTEIVDLVVAFNDEMAKNSFHKETPQSVGGVARIGLESFDIENGKFSLSENFVDQLKEGHSVYTQTAKQNQVHEELLKIYDGFGSLKKLGVINSPNLESIGIIVTEGLKETNVVYDPDRLISKIKD